MHHLTDRIIHTTACYTSRGALAGTRNSSMGKTTTIVSRLVTDTPCNNLNSSNMYDTKNKGLASFNNIPDTCWGGGGGGGLMTPPSPCGPLHMSDAI